MTEGANDKKTVPKNDEAWVDPGLLYKDAKIDPNRMAELAKPAQKAIKRLDGTNMADLVNRKPTQVVTASSEPSNTDQMTSSENK